MENQASDSQITATGMEQTASGSQTEAVGADNGPITGSQTVEATENDTFEKEMDEMWSIGTPDSDSPEEAVDIPEDNEGGPETPEDETELDEDSTPEEGEESLKETNNQEKIALKYLGQTIDVDINEAKELAERGLNLDRVQAKYDKLKPLEALTEPLSTMAYFYGCSLDDVVTNMASIDNMLFAEKQQIIDQGNTEEAADELIKSKIEAAKAKMEADVLKKGSEKGLSAMQKEQIKDFARAFPEADQNIKEGKAIPDEVIYQWKQGTPLTEAWLMHENQSAITANKDLSKEVKELKAERDKVKKDFKKFTKNTENKTKAPTSKKGTGGGSGHDDPFKGWDKF